MIEPAYCQGNVKCLLKFSPCRGDQERVIAVSVENEDGCVIAGGLDENASNPDFRVLTLTNIVRTRKPCPLT